MKPCHRTRSPFDWCCAKGSPAGGAFACPEHAGTGSAKAAELKPSSTWNSLSSGELGKAARKQVGGRSHSVRPAGAERDDPLETLANAHARGGELVEIAACLGKSDGFIESLTRFAYAYADLTEQDHARLLGRSKV